VILVAFKGLENREINGTMTIYSSVVFGAMLLVETTWNWSRSAEQDVHSFETLINLAPHTSPLVLGGICSRFQI
jgi:hypothetical protein